MTVTRLGPAIPLLNAGLGYTTQMPTGGTSGQVVTSNGSNGSYWGENIARITANGSNSNPLVGPFVNFSAGSNIIFSWASNSLTIAGSAGGGAVGTIITSNGSNSLAPVVNLVAGVGIALGVSGQDITITNTGVPGPAGGSSTFIGCRVSRAALQTLTTGTTTDIDMDTEDWDTDTMHFTSSANLTGTLAKTAGSAAVVGTGTSFTTELTVGQVISVPGTATEKRVVTVITDNTHLTVNANFANTATGQTAARVRSAVVFRTAGYYHVEAGVGYASNVTGMRYAIITLQSGATISSLREVAIPGVTGGAATQVPVAMDHHAAQWDFLTLQGNQSSGGNLNTSTAPGYTPTLSVALIGT